MRLEILALATAYQDYVDQIDQLAQKSLISSYGYGTDRVRAFIDAYQLENQNHIQTILIFDEKEELVALIPFIKASISKLLPITIYQNWVDDQNYVGDPLIHYAKRDLVIAYLHDYLKQQKSLIIFNVITNNYLNKAFEECGFKDKEIDAFDSAAIETDLSGDAYFKEYLRAKKRNKIKRMTKRLESYGKLEFKTLDAVKEKISEADQQSWIEQFMTLEQLGWKGLKGSAFASDKARKVYFEQCMKAWFENQKLIAFDAMIDGNVIASVYFVLEKNEHQMILRSQKTTYQESFSQASPGVVILHYALQYLLNHHKLDMIDACTIPDNEVANSLMKQRLYTGNMILSPNDWLTKTMLVPAYWMIVTRMKLRQMIKTTYLYFKRLKTKRSKNSHLKTKFDVKLLLK